ncbi:hypothetical protein [Shewanella youngdeokensis]|uniref:Porin n=1 Tax=Shewanella youngdeokensis TaxID=2999068 RepID=A0ABZ0K2S4_9GAMM|nr:hypothetical protein RGE70_09025 [Shewanella sp. DAU334]
MNVLLKVSTVAVLAALTCGTAHAKVLKADTSVAVGGRIHIGDDAQASNVPNKVVISATHQVFADWGQVYFRGRLENPFGIKDTAWQNKEATLNFQTFGDLYLNLGKTNFQFWLDESSFSNTKLHELSTLAGFSYKASLGKLNIKVGAGAAYSSGHVPYTPAFHGASYIGTRVNVLYPVNKSFLAYGMFDSRWDRDREFMDTYQWEEKHGHHIILGTKYKHTKNVSMSLSYHSFISYGGYNKDGQMVDVAVSYKF